MEFHSNGNTETLKSSDEERKAPLPFSKLGESYPANVGKSPLTASPVEASDVQVARFKQKDISSQKEIKQLREKVATLEQQAKDRDVRLDKHLSFFASYVDNLDFKDPEAVKSAVTDFFDLLQV